MTYSAIVSVVVSPFGAKCSRYMETYSGIPRYVSWLFLIFGKKRVVFNIGMLLGSKYVQPFGVGFRTHARALSSVERVLNIKWNSKDSIMTWTGDFNGDCQI